MGKFGEMARKRVDRELLSDEEKQWLAASEEAKGAGAGAGEAKAKEDPKEAQEPTRLDDYRPRGQVFERPNHGDGLDDLPGRPAPGIWA